MEHSKLLEDLRTSTLLRDCPERGEEQEVSRGESDELSGVKQENLQGESQRVFVNTTTRLNMHDSEAKDVFWSTSGDFTYCHHVEPRVNLYVSTEESFPVPLEYIDVTTTTLRYC